MKSLLACESKSRKFVTLPPRSHQERKKEDFLSITSRIKNEIFFVIELNKTLKKKEKTFFLLLPQLSGGDEIIQRIEDAFGLQIVMTFSFLSFLLFSFFFFFSSSSGKDAN